MIRPGQVWWSGRDGNRAVVYEVSPNIIRVILIPVAHKTRRGLSSVTWKHGVPKHYTIEYNPPQRSRP